MTTQKLIQTYFQKKDQLSINNPHYEKLVSSLFSWLIENDQVTNDLTTKTLFETDRTVTARIITRQNITVAGLEEIIFILKKFTSLSVKQESHDSEHLQAGNSLLTLSGSLHEILAY
jgi:nicotinate-nucleotide pyrophosphorylase